MMKTLKIGVTLATILTLTLTAGCNSMSTPNQPELSSSAKLELRTQNLIQEENEDIDQDKKEDNIRLIYEKEMHQIDLIINNQSYLVKDNFEWADNSIATVMEQFPKIDILKDRDGRHTIIVSWIWATNKIGSTVELFGFKYINGEIVSVLDLSKEKPEVDVAYLGDKQVKVTIPKLNLEQNLLVNGEDYKMLVDNQEKEEIALKEVFKEGAKIELGTHTDYQIKDLNNDGYEELITRRLSYYPTNPIGFKSVITIYNGIDSTWMHFYNRNSTEGILLDYVFEHGKIDIDGVKAAYGDAILSSDLEITLQRLLNEKILNIKDDNYYLNITID